MRKTTEGSQCERDRDEKSILAGIFRDHKLGKARNLNLEDFKDLRSMVIFDIMLALDEANLPITYKSVLRVLKGMKLEAEGRRYLEQIKNIDPAAPIL